MEIAIKLTGDVTVPVLVTDDGEVVAGSKEIAAWASRARTGMTMDPLVPG